MESPFWKSLRLWNWNLAMNKRLKTSLNFGFWLGLMFSTGLHIFGIAPILVGTLLGILVALAALMLKSEDDVAKTQREIELTDAKIEVLEELKK